MSSKNLYIFGCGHGITTPGKRSPRGGWEGTSREPVDDDERLIHEWDVVRLIATKLGSRLMAMGVDHILMNHLCEVDIRLGDRVRYVNWYHKRNPSTIYIPLHINAEGWGSRWTDARGVRIHHYSRSTLEMAQAMVEAFEANTQFPAVDTYKARFYKTVMGAPLYELRATSCPTLLPEMGFQTNLLDAKYLASEQGQDDCCDALAGFVQRWEGRQ